MITFPNFPIPLSLASGGRSLSARATLTETTVASRVRPGTRASCRWPSPPSTQRAWPRCVSNSLRRPSCTTALTLRTGGSSPARGRRPPHSSGKPGARSVCMRRHCVRGYGASPRPPGRDCPVLPALGSQGEMEGPWAANGGGQGHARPGMAQQARTELSGCHQPDARLAALRAAARGVCNNLLRLLQRLLQRLLHGLPLLLLTLTPLHVTTFFYVCIRTHAHACMCACMCEKKGCYNA